MYDFQVVIDAGHGGEDAGATANGVKEKDLNLEISRYMYEQFQKRGVPVTLIRSTDETISPTERVQRILDAYGNKPSVVVISNHINAAGSDITGAEGAEVIYALRNNDTLAKNILQALGNEGQVVRKYYQRRLPSDTSKDYYFIHRNTGVTQPVIVEYGFIDNPQDLARIQNNYKRYVDAVVNAVITTKAGGTINPTPGSGTTYIVKSGDSLWSIANKYNTTVDILKALNGLTSNNLTVGQVLELPSSGTSETGSTYTVKSGDSLWSIANKYNTTVNAIKTLNNLKTEQLYIGQILQLPTTSETPSTGSTYTVKSGDSLWSIANQYNTTVDNLKALNGLSGSSLSVGQVLKVPSSTGTEPTPTGSTYTVKSGDSLWSIANRYNTTVDNLKALNGLSGNSLSVGQILRVPSSSAPTGSTYTVRSGDSLWSIANRYNTTVDNLKALNGLTNNSLSIGQVLRVP